jgi:hypothetical protein
VEVRHIGGCGNHNISSAISDLWKSVTQVAAATTTFRELILLFSIVVELSVGERRKSAFIGRGNRATAGINLC